MCFIYKRLSIYADIIDDYQCWFHSNCFTINRSCADDELNIGKSYEHNIIINSLFTDFGQTEIKTKAAVVIQGMKTDYFEIKSSVQQGDALSDLLFTVTLRATISKISEKRAEKLVSMLMIFL